MNLQSDKPVWVDVIISEIGKMKTKLEELVSQRAVKDWYSTEEAANILGKSEYTVREWCRLRRIHASKKGSGRGKFRGWVISHTELLRIQKDGLLPIKN